METRIPESEHELWKNENGKGKIGKREEEKRLCTYTGIRNNESACPVGPTFATRIRNATNIEAT